jgi:hypothetical protein
MAKKTKEVKEEVIEEKVEVIEEKAEVIEEKIEKVEEKVEVIEEKAEKKKNYRNVFNGNYWFKAENRYVKPGEYFTAYEKDLEFGLKKGYIQEINF